VTLRQNLDSGVPAHEPSVPIESQVQAREFSVAQQLRFESFMLGCTACDYGLSGLSWGACTGVKLLFGALDIVRGAEGGYKQM